MVLNVYKNEKNENGKNIKIALIDIPEVKVTFEANGKEEVYSKITTNYVKYPQLILAGALKGLGDIEIVDMKLLDPAREELYKQFPYGNGTVKCFRKGASFESIKDKITDSDIISLTANFTKSAGVATDFIKYVKSINPKSKIIVGGSDATPRYDYYLRNGADAVVLGEGERIVPRLIKSLNEGEPLDNLSGIAYKENGLIRYNPRNPPTDNVAPDEIPFPAFDLVKEDLGKFTEAFDGDMPTGVKTPIVAIETSRGCANACPFCTTSFLKKGYRPMSTERIEELLKHYKKYGIQTLVFIEDNILSRLTLPGGREKVIEMFDLLKKYGFAWEFGNGLETGKFMDSDGVINEELIEKMFYHEIIDDKYVGAFRTYMPLESLHEEPQNIYKKLRPYDEELEIIKAIADANVPVMTFGVIIGRPDDTKESLKLTRKRCLEIKRVVESRGVKAYFTPFTDILLPGTPDFRKYGALLKYDIEKYPELFQLHTATFGTKEYAPEELTVLKRRMEERLNGKEARQVWGSTGKYHL